MSIRDEVQAFNESFCKLVANQDVDGLVEFYRPDARLLPPGVPALQGPDAIRGFFEMMLEAGVKELELDSAFAEESGGLVIDTGAYRLTVVPPGGDPVVDIGKYLVVLKRGVDGALRLAYDTFNSDTAPPAG